MRAIYRKELKSLFFSMRSYAALALLLVSWGFSLSFYNLLSSSADLSYALASTRLSLIVAIPLLTSSLFTRDRRAGLDRWLLSLPLSAGQLVLGKFLALLTCLLIPFAGIALSPLLLASLGSFSLAAAYTAICGELLLWLALAALCALLSSAVTSAGIAFALSAGVALLLYVLGALASLLPSIPFLSDLLYTLALFDRANGFFHSRFDLSAALFFLTVTAVSLALTWLLLKKTQHVCKTRTPARTVFVVVLLLLSLTVNLITPLLPYSIAKPAVGKEAFSVSGTSIDFLRTLGKKVTVSLICEGGSSYADGDIYAFLQSYAQESDLVSVEVLDPRRSEAEIKTLCGGKLPSNKSILVSSDLRTRVIDYLDLFYYYNEELDMLMTPAEYESALSSFTGDYAAYLSTFIATTTAYFDGDALVTGAIRFVTEEEVPLLYTLVGGNGSAALDSKLQKRLSSAGYELRVLSSLESIPDDCSLLVINAPSKDLSPTEAFALSSYLDRGNDLFLTTYYATQELPRLSSILSSYGLGFADTDLTVVAEGDESYMITGEGSDARLFYTHINSEHPITNGFSGLFLVDLAHAITLTDTEGVTLTSWLYSSDKAHLSTYNEETKTWTDAEAADSYTVGAIAQKGESSILWISCPYALTASYNEYSEGGNFALAASAFNHFSGSTLTPLSIPASEIASSLLSVTVSTLTTVGLLSIVLLPVGTLLIGAAIIGKRRKR